MVWVGPVGVETGAAVLLQRIEELVLLCWSQWC